ncbi:MAG: tetratricopeptide repeat protein, partial [Deltaproteobacteria bacterium]|nr:tetratricopeptide repeat protein [Deltaproteobacteria bacterium]
MAPIVALALALFAPPVWANDPAAAAKMTRLNRSALDAFDNLNFDQAKTLLEQALSQGETSGLQTDPVTARTHLNLGMVLIAGFQQRDQAIDHFKAALKVQPDITAATGVFNPEVQSVFDEVKAGNAGLQADPEITPPPPATPRRAPVVSAPRSGGQGEEEGEEQGEKEGEDQSEEEGEAEDEAAGAYPKVLLSVALGSGFGLAKGKLDANRDLDSN